MADLQERAECFHKEIQEVGRLLYTTEMLIRFEEHWLEPNRAKGKAQKFRFEIEKTWDTKKRLARWARNNYDNIRVYLTDAEKTIKQKKYDFAVSLEPFLPKYGRDVLNAFYNWWTTPENKPNPVNLRWEEQPFWGLETKLQEWVKRNERPRF